MIHHEGHGHNTFDWAKTCEKNRLRGAVMKEFEDGCLAEFGEGCYMIPEACSRLVHFGWRQIVKSRMYPHNKDVDWEGYCEWDRSGGGADPFTVGWRV